MEIREGENRKCICGCELYYVFTLCIVGCVCSGLRGSYPHLRWTGGASFLLQEHGSVCQEGICTVDGCKYVYGEPTTASVWCHTGAGVKGFHFFNCLEVILY